MKIYDWRRFCIFIAILIGFTAIIWGQFTKEETPEPTTQNYTIQQGDTLWGIATAHRPKNMSIQEYIYNLEKHNQITAEIHAGQRIEVLIY